MFLGGRIFREFPVDGDGFGVPMVLLVQPREFQQPIAIVRVELRGRPEMRHGIRQPVLPDLCVRQAQFGRGRFRIQIQSGAVLLLGLGASPDSSSAWAQYSRGRNSLGFRSTAGCRYSAAALACLSRMRRMPAFNSASYKPGFSSSTFLYSARLSASRFSMV